MKNNALSETYVITIAGLLVLATFLVLGFTEYRIETATDPSRFHLSFPEAKGSSLETELCQEGPARDFSISAFIESADAPYFETDIAVESRGCVMIPIPIPEILPDEQLHRVRVRAEDTDGRALEIFRML